MLNPNMAIKIELRTLLEKKIENFSLSFALDIRLESVKSTALNESIWAVQCLIAMSGFITLDTWDEICVTSCVNIDAHWYRKILKGSLMSIVLWYFTRWNKHMTHIWMPCLVSGICRLLWTLGRKGMFHYVWCCCKLRQRWKKIRGGRKSQIQFGNTQRMVILYDS